MSLKIPIEPILEKPYRITLDLYQNTYVPLDIIYVKGDKNAYPLVINLTAQGKPYSLPPGTVCWVNITRPDGITDSAPADISDAQKGELVYNILGSEISAEGSCKIDIRMIDGENNRILSWYGGVYTVAAVAGGSEAQPPGEMTQWVLSVEQMTSSAKALSEKAAETAASAQSLAEAAQIEAAAAAAHAAGTATEVSQSAQCASQAAAAASEAAYTAEMSAAAAIAAKNAAGTAVLAANTVKEEIKAAAERGDFNGEQGPAGPPGTPGQSVSITENPGNGPGAYRLDIHNENPAVPDVTTPDLLAANIITIKDSTNNAEYLVNLRLINGKPAVEYTQI